MTEVTVETVEEATDTVAYCDICGGTDGSLEENGAYHFHTDCAETVFTDRPESLPHDTVTKDNSASGLDVGVRVAKRAVDHVRTGLTKAKDTMHRVWSAVPSVKTLRSYVPDERIPPVFLSAGGVLATFLSDHAARIVLWPIGGLWWASEIDIFGGQKRRRSSAASTVLDYIFGLAIWFAVLGQPILIVFA